jgi:hypothetical protein
MVGAGPAPIIAAAMARARRRVLGAFRDADANAPERAIAFTPGRRLEERYFDRLVDFGALIDTGKGTFYMDEAKVAEHTAKRRKRALMMFGGVVATTAAVLGLTQL